MEIKFLNKMDSAIFKNLNPNHQAITGKTFVHALIGGIIISLIVFGMQMGSVERNIISITGAVGIILLAAWLIKYALPTLQAFPTWTGRIVYGIYILVLGYLAFFIAMWMVFIAIALLIFYVVFKIFFDQGGSSTYKVTDENGRERKLKKCGWGKYKDEDGNYWHDNGNGTVTRE